MRRLVMKKEEEIWPTVILRDKKIIIYYIGKRDDDVKVEETRKMDFEKIMKKLERGKSIFITLKPIERELGDASRWP